MRAILAFALLAASGPAAAQVLSPGDQFQLDNIRLQQEAAARRAIDQSNALMAREAQQRADQAIVDLRLQGEASRLLQPPYEPAPRSAPPEVQTYPSIPDAALAESERRVRDAARNRR